MGWTNILTPDDWGVKNGVKCLWGRPWKSICVLESTDIRSIDWGPKCCSTRHQDSLESIQSLRSSRKGNPVELDWGGTNWKKRFELQARAVSCNSLNVSLSILLFPPWRCQDFRKVNKSTWSSTWRALQTKDLPASKTLIRARGSLTTIGRCKISDFQ